jgi:hypothetical protein
MPCGAVTTCSGALSGRTSKPSRPAAKNSKRTRPMRRTSPGLLRLAINVWPPFRGAGVRVRHIAADWHETRVELNLGLFNRNYVGTHFGGSLYAMTDPFHMLMLIHLLGPEYAVNHKGGRIDYLAPARGRVTTTLRIEDAEVDAIRARVAAAGKDAPEFSADILDAEGMVVARAVHTLHVRRKGAAAP